MGTSPVQAKRRHPPSCSLYLNWEQSGEVVNMNQTCRKCNRILPNTDEYFFKSSGNKCKECLGRKFGKRKLINDGVEEGYLRCAKCKEVKEANLTNFYKGRNNKYNLYGECKICCKIRKQKYKEKNREKILKQSREYHQKNKEREKAYSKEYYEKNKETIKKKSHYYVYLNYIYHRQG